MDFHSLSRKELQALCKKNKIPANMTNVAMADALAALDHVEGLEELSDPSEQDLLQSAKKTANGTPGILRSAGRTSTRKKQDELKSAQPLTRTRRGKSSSVEEGIDSGCPKIDIQTKENEENEENQRGTYEPVTPKPYSRRRAAATAALSKQEISVQRVYSTRRSARLLEKNMERLSLTENEKEKPLNISESFENISKGTELKEQTMTEMVSKETIETEPKTEVNESAFSQKIEGEFKVQEGENRTNEIDDLESPELESGISETSDVPIGSELTENFEEVLKDHNAIEVVEAVVEADRSGDGTLELEKSEETNVVPHAEPEDDINPGTPLLPVENVDEGKSEVSVEPSMDSDISGPSALTSTVDPMATDELQHEEMEDDLDCDVECISFDTPLMPLENFDEGKPEESVEPSMDSDLPALSDLRRAVDSLATADQSEEPCEPAVINIAGESEKEKSLDEDHFNSQKSNSDCKEDADQTDSKNPDLSGEDLGKNSSNMVQMEESGIAVHHYESIEPESADEVLSPFGIDNATDDQSQEPCEPPAINIAKESEKEKALDEDHFYHQKSNSDSKEDADQTDSKNPDLSGEDLKKNSSNIVQMGESGTIKPESADEVLSPFDIDNATSGMINVDVDEGNDALADDEAPKPSLEMIPATETQPVIQEYGESGNTCTEPLAGDQLASQFPRPAKKESSAKEHPIILKVDSVLDGNEENSDKVKTPLEDMSMRKLKKKLKEMTLAKRSDKGNNNTDKQHEGKVARTALQPLPENQMNRRQELEKEKLRAGN